MDYAVRQCHSRKPVEIAVSWEKISLRSNAVVRGDGTLRLGIDSVELQDASGETLAFVDAHNPILSGEEYGPLGPQFEVEYEQNRIKVPAGFDPDNSFTFTPSMYVPLPLLKSLLPSAFNSAVVKLVGRSNPDNLLAFWDFLGKKREAMMRLTPDDYSTLSYLGI